MFHVLVWLSSTSFGFPLQSKDLVSLKWFRRSCEIAWPSFSLCVSPVMDRQPVWCAPFLYDSWDRVMRWPEAQMENGWVDKLKIVEYFWRQLQINFVSLKKKNTPEAFVVPKDTGGQNAEFFVACGQYFKSHCIITVMCNHLILASQQKHMLHVLIRPPTLQKEMFAKALLGALTCTRQLAFMISEKTPRAGLC